MTVKDLGLGKVQRFIWITVTADKTPQRSCSWRLLQWWWSTTTFVPYMKCLSKYGLTAEVLCQAVCFFFYLSSFSWAMCTLVTTALSTSVQRHPAQRTAMAIAFPPYKYCLPLVREVKTSTSMKIIFLSSNSHLQKGSIDLLCYCFSALDGEASAV